MGPVPFHALILIYIAMCVLLPRQAPPLSMKDLDFLSRRVASPSAG